MQAIDAGKTRGDKVLAAVTQLGLDALLTFHHDDFHGASQTFAAATMPFDFAFLDCGGYSNYQDFMDEYWPLVNPDGGLLLIHSTLTNFEGLAFLNSLKLKQAMGGLADFESLSLLEPHKTRQNSFTMIRKVVGVRDRIYTYQPWTVSLDVILYVPRTSAGCQRIGSY
jgi:hypothetical protein